VHARGGDGQTPLHFASTIEIAEYLLAHGADIDARDIDHESTPAQYMVRDRQQIARYLVSRGCQTDILMAAALGDLDLVRKHLDRDPSCIRRNVSERYFPKTNSHGGGTIYIWTLGQYWTAHRAAREFSHLEALDLLMERSPADLKLSSACELGDEAAVRFLIASQPDTGRTLPEEERRKVTDAALNNNDAAVRLMLEAGWPVDARGQHGATPLHWAAWNGNLEMLHEILRYQPQLELKENDFKGTPLGWAIHGSKNGWRRAQGDYPGVVEALIDAGAEAPELTDGLEASEPVREVLRRDSAKKP
ncbi:MAG: ankyrin repeat domain-containing protein, partial [Bryobacteraceae bacterium]